jgi:alcohol dehydrogenase class IV
VKAPLFITDQGLVRCGAMDRVRAIFGDRIPGSVFDEIPENPTFQGVDAAFGQYKKANCDSVVAVGGGSVIDSAKIVAVLATHRGKASDIVGFSERINRATAPLIVIPTTSGTGSEASPDAGVHPDSSSRSSGITSRYAVPAVAICDPVITLTLPPRLTAATALDALSHCVEGYLAVGDTPIIDVLALDGIRRVSKHVRRATQSGDDLGARNEMMVAAFQGGVAIGKGLGPAHAIAICCGDQGLHHGLLSALGIVASLPVMQAHEPQKVNDISAAMNLKPNDDPSDALRGLMRDLGLPTSLREAGYRVKDMNELARACEASHFNFSSPYRPTAADFAGMLAAIH